MIGLAEIEARVRGLDRLSRGQAKEVTEMRAGDNPLLYLQRKGDLRAIRGVVAEVEWARVAMVKPPASLDPLRLGQSAPEDRIEFAEVAPTSCGCWGGEAAGWPLTGRQADAGRNFSRRLGVVRA